MSSYQALTLIIVNITITSITEIIVVIIALIPTITEMVITAAF